MISTRVKPDLRDVLNFILITFLFCGMNEAAGGLLFIAVSVHLFACCDRVPEISSSGAKGPPDPTDDCTVKELGAANCGVLKKKPEAFASGCN
jgi:hypothetical protein